MTNPPEGSNVIVTFIDGTEAYLYFWQGTWTAGVENDPLDVEVEPTAIVSWRYP